MKKLLCALLILSMVFSFVACTESNLESNQPSSTISGNNDSSDLNDDEYSSDSIGDDNNSDDGSDIGDDNKNDGDNDNENDGGNDNGNDDGNDNGSDDGNGGFVIPTEEKATWVGYLVDLLSNFRRDPKSFIPKTMLPEYNTHTVSSEDIITDFSKYTDISNLIDHGFGEQWHMVIDNINQSQIFFNALGVVDTLSTASVSIFELFIDENPNETAQYTFNEGIYSVTIRCTALTIEYVIDYTADIPVLGTQTVQISLSMNILTRDKDVRVQIGDANALKYELKGKSYTFAMKYLDVSLGSRTAYFSIEETEKDVVKGRIYEYITVLGVDKSSIADFYITDDYVTVVGNKTGEALDFNDYICELYSTDTGYLIGIEYMDKKILSGTDDILWFDLDCITGIKSIRFYDEAFYLNSSTKKWKGNSDYDIEFRTQYFYYYDSEKEEYEEIAVEVPMIYIKADKLEKFENSVEDSNDIKVSLNVNKSNLNRIMSDYAKYIDILLENREVISSEYIKAFIGQKITF